MRLREISSTLRLWQGPRFLFITFQLCNLLEITHLSVCKVVIITILFLAVIWGLTHNIQKLRTVMRPQYTLSVTYHIIIIIITKSETTWRFYHGFRKSEKFRSIRGLYLVRISYNIYNPRKKNGYQKSPFCSSLWRNNFCDLHRTPLKQARHVTLLNPSESAGLMGIKYSE